MFTYVFNRWRDRRGRSSTNIQFSTPAPAPPHGLFINGLANVAGLVCELPAAPHSVSAAGPCDLGVFSYVNGRLDMSCARVGRYCSIGPDCVIGTGNHNLEFVSTHPFVEDPSGVACGIRGVPAYNAIAGTAARAPGRRRSEKVEIGHDVWIGARVVVLGGVTIGHGAVVAAGAVVTRDVESYAIVAGVPARVVRHRFDPETVRRLLATAWWEYDLADLGPDRDYTDVPAFLTRMESGLADGTIGRPAFARILIRQGRLRLLDLGEDAEQARVLPAEDDTRWQDWR